MRKRSFSTAILIIVFLVSAWGNVIAAAFCPWFASDRACSIKHVAHQSKQVKHQLSCHEDMAGMKMGYMQMEMDDPSDSESRASAQDSQIKFISEAPGDEVAFDLPIQSCPHCLRHSQPTSGSISVIAGDPSRRLVETAAPPAEFALASLSAFHSTIMPSEHGPPGRSLPHHVLLNVFRI